MEENTAADLVRLTTEKTLPAMASVSRKQGEGNDISPNHLKFLVEVDEFHPVSPKFCKIRNIKMQWDRDEQSRPSETAINTKMPLMQVFWVLR